MFDRQHNEITRYLARRSAAGKVREYRHDGGNRLPWPTDEHRNMVMAGDTAVELGNPKDASVSFLYWLEDPGPLQSGRISVVGPDIAAADGMRLPFGKVVIVGGLGFDAENRFDRYREMALMSCDLHLKGYMVRAASHYGREWGRVSREALRSGFSFSVLGGAIIDQYMQLDYVRAVEVIFVTAGCDDVLALRETAAEIGAIIGAMNKMAEEMSFDCDACEYAPVCGDVSELRAMRRALQKRGAASHA